MQTKIRKKETVSKEDIFYQDNPHMSAISMTKSPTLSSCEVEAASEDYSSRLVESDCHDGVAASKHRDPRSCLTRVITVHYEMTPDLDGFCTSLKT